MTLIKDLSKIIGTLEMDKLFNDIQVGIAAWIHNTAPLARLTLVDFTTPVEMLILSSNTNGKYNIDINQLSQWYQQHIHEEFILQKMIPGRYWI
jgi:hypothetical protein